MCMDCLGFNEEIIQLSLIPPNMYDRIWLLIMNMFVSVPEYVFFDEEGRHVFDSLLDTHGENHKCNLVFQDRSCN